MPITGKFSAILLAGAVLLGLAGCQKNEPSADKGPAETAGEKIDQATAKAAEEINKAAEAAGQGLAKAGDKLQGAAENAQSSNQQSGDEQNQPVQK